MLTTLRKLKAMLDKLVDKDAPIMLKLKGEVREFPLDIEENYILDGALHLNLEQTVQNVADEESEFALDPRARFAQIERKLRLTKRDEIARLPRPSASPHAKWHEQLALAEIRRGYGSIENFLESLS